MNTETDLQTPSLQSTYALEQLQALAKDTDPPLFVTLLMSVFGTDLPVDTYQKMQTALRDGSIASPPYQVDAQGSDVARYDGTSRTIFVTDSAITQSQTEDYQSVNLLSAMTKTFGEYLNDVIRQDLDDRSTEHARQVSPEENDDTGKNYAAMIFFSGTKAANGTVFGDYSGADYQGPLKLTLPKSEYTPDPGGFSAGKGNEEQGSFGHESLERGLALVGFSDEERRSIYFGNWLRDHSQLVDPKIVRKEDAPKDFPSKLSRAALTQLVDLLALKEFNDLQDTPEGRQAYTVVPEMLGVYRPSEHIDNPLNPDPDASDPQEIDSDFEPLVTHGDPLLEIDQERSVSRYVDNAVRYMYERLIAAMQEGNTVTGRRYFGDALHVLEDYFSHSNFVELCLRKRGHDVLPWTTESDARHGLAIVTGRFGGLDVIASIAEPLGKIFFSVKDLAFERTEPGYRSDAEKVLLIVLAEHQSDVPLTWLNQYLTWRDEAANNPLFKLYEVGSWATRLPLTFLQNAMNTVFQGILGWLGDSVDDLQTASGDNPNEKAGVHPTHSQLAKDHDTHPFHDLAAYLATYAVGEVGRSMYQYWQGDKERDPANVAKSFILHPNDNNWHDDIVAAWEAKDRERSSNSIRQGSRLDELTALKKRLREEEEERVKVLGESFRNAPNSVSEIIGNAFPFG